MIRNHGFVCMCANAINTQINKYTKVDVYSFNFSSMAGKKTFKKYILNIEHNISLKITNSCKLIEVFCKIVFSLNLI